MVRLVDGQSLTHLPPPALGNQNRLAKIKHKPTVSRMRITYIGPLLLAVSALGQTNLEPRLRNLEQSRGFVEAGLEKRVNDLLWIHELEDVARVQKVRFTGPPALRKGDTTPKTNEIIVYAYTFLPRKEAKGKLPLIVLVHGDVHGDLKPQEDGRIVRELINEGYAVIAPEYRGSSGYGRDYWELIDYGGLENDDVLAARNWMLDNNPNVDAKRVGIMGWSHGGMIALMNVLVYTNAYQVAYAGVPVTDLVLRFGYKPPDYKELFSAPFHIGKAPDEDIEEYRRRSPVTHAHKLQTPLLIHAATNDDDVHLIEIERLLDALKTTGRKFEHKIYTNPPGGHEFNRIDTRLARESRAEVYKFLRGYLKP
jgi:dipeptidyl aminopeptidase/acylaminoacyl peptidase